MSLSAFDLDLEPSRPSPLDAFEQVLSTYHMDYHRTPDDELILSVRGQCGSYQLHLSWQAEFNALQTVCSFADDLPLPPAPALARLLMKTNAMIWLGHFEYALDHHVQFRYTMRVDPDLPMGGIDTMNDLFKLAVAECDRFYPALILMAAQPDAPDTMIDFALADVAGQG